MRYIYIHISRRSVELVQGFPVCFMSGLLGLLGLLHIATSTFRVSIPPLYHIYIYIRVHHHHHIIIIIVYEYLGLSKELFKKSFKRETGIVENHVYIYILYIPSVPWKAFTLRLDLKLFVLNNFLNELVFSITILT